MDTDRLLRELNDFLRIPSISTSPSHDADCRAAAEWVAAELRRLGCDDVQFLASETHPVVWGAGPDVPGAPTLLVYGHYDVQPPDPLNEWTTPPFEPAVRGGQLFARGAADDKGQVFCLLKAIAANGTHSRPPGQIGSPLGGVRRRRAQCPRGAGPPARPAEDARRQDPRARLLRGGAAPIQAGARHVEALAVQGR